MAVSAFAKPRLLATGCNIALFEYIPYYQETFVGPLPANWLILN